MTFVPTTLAGWPSRGVGKGQYRLNRDDDEPRLNETRPAVAPTRDTMTTTNPAISRTEILRAADKIEPLPAALSRLLRLLADDDFQITALVEILSHDPALAGDVLARANSIASGAVRQIGDLRQAVARIGSREIVSISMRRAMRSRFTESLPTYGLDADALWRHCITASVAAEAIRREASAPVAPMIGTTALIHDVGKLVISECVPPNAVSLLNEVADREALPLHVVEREVLGLDHAEVGGVVARTWGLPASAQVALTQHHTPEPDDLFTHALVLADRLAHTSTEFREHLADGRLSVEDDPSEWIAEALPDIARPVTVVGIAPSRIAELVVAIADETTEILAYYA